MPMEAPAEFEARLATDAPGDLKPWACRDCMFWVETIMGNIAHDIPGVYGVCHRYPRTATKRDIDWCGEFSPRPQTMA